MVEAHLPPEGVDGAEGCSRGQQHVRQQEPEDAEVVERVLEGPRRHVFERRVVVGDEGPDAHHVRAELLQEDEVSREVCRRLVRRAHHEPCADRVAERAQIAKTLHAVFEAHVRRVEFLIVLLRGGLVPQQVPVRAGLFQGRVAFIRPFAQGQGDGTVGVFGFDLSDDIAEHVVREVTVFAALQNERTKAQVIATADAVHDLGFTQSVSLKVGIAFTDATIVAVVLTYVGKFD